MNHVSTWGTPSFSKITVGAYSLILHYFWFLQVKHLWAAANLTDASKLPFKDKDFSSLPLKFELSREQIGFMFWNRKSDWDKQNIKTEEFEMQLVLALEYR